MVRTDRGEYNLESNFVGDSSQHKSDLDITCHIISVGSRGEALGRELFMLLLGFGTR